LSRFHKTAVGASKTLVTSSSPYPRVRRNGGDDAVANPDVEVVHPVARPVVVLDHVNVAECGADAPTRPNLFCAEADRVA
jgi:hypothetical protein